MRNIAKVTYTDGHTSEAPLTPRVITSCEEHAQKEGGPPATAAESASPTTWRTSR